MGELQRTILRAHHREKNAMEKFLHDFAPLLKKYARKLGDEDAEPELVLFAIELMDSFPVEKFSEGDDAKMVSYINKAVVHHYYKLDKKRRKPWVFWEDLDEEPVFDGAESSYEEAELALLLQGLTEKQREILKMSFFERRPVAEIGRKLGISRQAVNQNRKRALEKLKEELEKDRRGRCLRY